MAKLESLTPGEFLPARETQREFFDTSKAPKKRTARENPKQGAFKEFDE
jgi:hypothetical protein